MISPKDVKDAVQFFLALKEDITAECVEGIIIYD